MKISFKNYPIDIIICIIWSIILLPIALFNVENIIRIILGLPFILFIPGYILIFVLFPAKKTEKGIDIIERIALSFGLSIAIVPLIGLGLNYTHWGIRLEPILLSIFLFILILGLLAIYRWFKTNPKDRFIIHFNIEFPKSDNKIDKILTIILIISIILSISALIYVIVTPKTGEKFTEFYLLGSEGIADNYPDNLSAGQNTSIIIGVVNHEYKTINYTIEIWLINQTLQYNETSKENITIYHNMYFIDSIQTTLNHTQINIEETWKPQWEYNQTFSINKTGYYKLAFLLFTNETNNYQSNYDYKEIANEKINEAYRSTHIWIKVT